VDDVPREVRAGVEALLSGVGVRERPAAAANRGAVDLDIAVLAALALPDGVDGEHDEAVASEGDTRPLVGGVGLRGLGVPTEEQHCRV